MSNPHPNVAPERIDYIDAWRFLAVVMVILSHVFVYSGLKMEFLNPYLSQLDRLGELGVLIFFVISGFVICSGLVAEKNSTGTICLSAFYLRRFYRIMPPLWLYLAALLLLNAFGVIEIAPRQALISATFLCNMPFPDGCSWYAGHTWSLAYEEQFYLMFPLLMPALPLIGNSRRFAWFIAGLGIMSSILLAREQTFAGEYLLYFVFLLLGCCSALLPRAAIDHIRHMPVAAWLAVIALLLGSVGFVPDSIEKQLNALFYPVLIVLMVLGTPVRVKAVAAVFRNPAVCYLGRISYTVYLWQELVTGDYLGWPTMALIGAVFAFAMVSYRYLELPLQKKATALSNELKAAAIMRTGLHRGGKSTF
ncbi:MAG: acyltransferase family protein [Methylobacter sp.]